MGSPNNHLNINFDFLSMSNYIPWVEKYRPSNFKEIVLDPINRRILKNVIQKKYFPNILFYGPPGTGKTTTIMNIIDKYQTKHREKRKDLVIHLNASDDRGIDVIRNQINQFVTTKSLFGKGKKFIILDEVDYMTKNAQNALRYLIQQYRNDAAFCLICNYISRIDTSLQNEFIRLKFCKLPKTDTHKFLKKIVKNEKIRVTPKELTAIQELYQSDIRSMINHLQSINYSETDKINTVDKATMEKFIKKIVEDKNLQRTINNIHKKYEIEKTQFINDFIIYIIKNKSYARNKTWLKNLQYMIYNIDSDADSNTLVELFCITISGLYKTMKQ